ncbi:MAG: glycosyltransferase [Candidatus Celaenobacter antarcticus]|nr:glycosyltransferase [Candidatus Celaenobacter antarcticus]
MNNENIKVSVIIPAYNSAKFIREAVESVSNQTHKNLEIIIIDDGSTDDTKQIVQNYNDRIKYFYQKNEGAAAARNLGITKSTGDYIAFLDADDIWEKYKIEKQLSIITRYPEYKFVYCDVDFVNSNKKTIQNYPRKVEILKGDILLPFINKYFLLLPTIILDSKCISKIGYFNKNLKVGEDFDFILRLTKNYKGYGIGEKLYMRRIHKNSLSRQDYKLDSQNDISILKNFIKENPVFYKKNEKILKKRLSELHFKFGYRLLSNSKNLEAFYQFLVSLNCSLNFKSMKNIFLCFIPKNTRDYIKKRKL